MYLLVAPQGMSLCNMTSVSATVWRQRGLNQSYVFPTPYLAVSRKFGLWDAVGEPFVFERPNLAGTFPELFASSVANGVPIG